MQYLQLMYTYAPAWGFGGPSRMMYDYARWLVGAGSPTLVIAGDVNHDYRRIPARQQILDGIPIERVRVFWPNLVRRSLNCVSPMMFFRAIGAIYRFKGVTVIHIAEFRSPVFLYAAIARRLFPRKVVLVHSAFGMLHHRESRLRRYFDAILMGMMLRSVDVALAQNEHELAVYCDENARYRSSRNNVKLVPLHASRTIEEQMLSSGQKRELRARYAIPEDAFTCIFLGRLHPAKGVLRAIDAFLQFSASHRSPTLFLIVGRDDGFQREILAYIERLGIGHLVLVKNDVYEQRFDYYSLSDVYLGFPTIYEETMLAAVESLSCATPVVVSREADMPFVEQEGGGFIIDYTVAGAAHAIARVAADHAEFRGRAHDTFRRHFAEGSASSRFRAVLADAVKIRGQGI